MIRTPEKNPVTEHCIYLRKSFSRFIIFTLMSHIRDNHSPILFYRKLSNDCSSSRPSMLMSAGSSSGLYRCENPLMEIESDNSRPFSEQNDPFTSKMSHQVEEIIDRIETLCLPDSDHSDISIKSSSVQYSDSNPTDLTLQRAVDAVTEWDEISFPEDDIGSNYNRMNLGHRQSILCHTSIQENNLGGGTNHYPSTQLRQQRFSLPDEIKAVQGLTLLSQIVSNPQPTTQETGAQSTLSSLNNCETSSVPAKKQMELSLNNCDSSGFSQVTRSREQVSSFCNSEILNRIIVEQIGFSMINLHLSPTVTLEEKIDVSMINVFESSIIIPEFQIELYIENNNSSNVSMDKQVDFPTFNNDKRSSNLPQDLMDSSLITTNQKPILFKDNKIDSPCTNACPSSFTLLGQKNIALISNYVSSRLPADQLIDAPVNENNTSSSVIPQQLIDVSDIIDTCDETNQQVQQIHEQIDLSKVDIRTALRTFPNTNIDLPPIEDSLPPVVLSEQNSKESLISISESSEILLEEPINLCILDNSDSSIVSLEEQLDLSLLDNSKSTDERTGQSAVSTEELLNLTLIHNSCSSNLPMEEQIDSLLFNKDESSVEHCVKQPGVSLVDTSAFAKALFEEQSDASFNNTIGSLSQMLDQTDLTAVTRSEFSSTVQTEKEIGKALVDYKNSSIASPVKLINSSTLPLPIYRPSEEKVSSSINTLGNSPERDTRSSDLQLRFDKRKLQSLPLNGSRNDSLIMRAITDTHVVKNISDLSKNNLVICSDLIDSNDRIQIPNHYSFNYNDKIESQYKSSQNCYENLSQLKMSNDSVTSMFSSAVIENSDIIEGLENAVIQWSETTKCKTEGIEKSHEFNKTEVKNNKTVRTSKNVMSIVDLLDENNGIKSKKTSEMETVDETRRRKVIEKINLRSGHHFANNCENSSIPVEQPSEEKRTAHFDISGICKKPCSKDAHCLPAEQRTSSPAVISKPLYRISNRMEIISVKPPPSSLPPKLLTDKNICIGNDPSILLITPPVNEVAIKHSEESSIRHNLGTTSFTPKNVVSQLCKISDSAVVNQVNSTTNITSLSSVTPTVKKRVGRPRKNNYCTKRNLPASKTVSRRRLNPTPLSQVVMPPARVSPFCSTDHNSISRTYQNSISLSLQNKCSTDSLMVQNCATFLNQSLTTSPLCTMACGNQNIAWQNLNTPSASQPLIPLKSSYTRRTPKVVSSKNVKENINPDETIAGAFSMVDNSKPPLTSYPFDSPQTAPIDFSKVILPRNLPPNEASSWSQYNPFQQFISYPQSGNVLAPSQGYHHVPPRWNQFDFPGECYVKGKFVRHSKQCFQIPRNEFVRNHHERGVTPSHLNASMPNGNSCFSSVSNNSFPFENNSNNFPSNRSSLPLSDHWHNGRIDSTTSKSNCLTSSHHEFIISALKNPVNTQMNSIVPSQVSTNPVERQTIASVRENTFHAVSTNNSAPSHDYLDSTFHPNPINPSGQSALTLNKNLLASTRVTTHALNEELPSPHSLRQSDDEISKFNSNVGPIVYSIANSTVPYEKKKMISYADHRRNDTLIPLKRRFDFHPNNDAVLLPENPFISQGTDERPSHRTTNGLSNIHQNNASNSQANIAVNLSIKKNYIPSPGNSVTPSKNTSIPRILCSIPLYKTNPMLREKLCSSSGSDFSQVLQMNSDGPKAQPTVPKGQQSSGSQVPYPVNDSSDLNLCSRGTGDCLVSSTVQNLSNSSYNDSLYSLKENSRSTAERAMITAKDLFLNDQVLKATLLKESIGKNVNSAEELFSQDRIKNIDYLVWLAGVIIEEKKDFIGRTINESVTKSAKYRTASTTKSTSNNRTDNASSENNSSHELSTGFPHLFENLRYFLEHHRQSGLALSRRSESSDDGQIFASNLPIKKRKMSSEEGDDSLSKRNPVGTTVVPCNVGYCSQTIGPSCSKLMDSLPSNADGLDLSPSTTNLVTDTPVRNLTDCIDKNLTVKPNYSVTRNNKSPLPLCESVSKSLLDSREPHRQRDPAINNNRRPINFNRRNAKRPSTIDSRGLNLLADNNLTRVENSCGNLSCSVQLSSISSEIESGAATEFSTERISFHKPPHPSTTTTFITDQSILGQNHIASKRPCIIDGPKPLASIPIPCNVQNIMNAPVSMNMWGTIPARTPWPISFASEGPPDIGPL